ncbi:MAG: hypothetical protein ABWW65_07565 [Thermoprotei archaeon]
MEEHIYDFLGLRYRVLFSRWGYAPHYAEHVVDPVDKREKLVLADPHIRHSVYIYDPVKKEIEWEYRVPGSRVPNPHIAHMVTDDNPITGPYWSRVADKLGAEPGDIVCADMNNRLIVVDRDKQVVKKTISVPDTSWLHDVIPSKKGDGLIIDDYSGGWVRKVDFSGKVLWSLNVKQASKISTVYATATTHIESFGGDYLVVSNSNPEGVYEIRDSNGEIVWSCPCKPPCINATWLYHPHSAFRYGLAEAEGNVTIIGLEGGGGIIAVDRECRPRWGFMKTHTNMLGEEYRELYRPTIHGFFETTHVFPLLSGGIGAIDWKGKYSSQVVEILGIPTRTVFTWLLAWDYELSEKWVYFDPPIEISEWDYVLLEIINLGGGSAEWEIYGTRLPQLYPWDYPSHWYRVYSHVVDSDSSDQYDLLIGEDYYTAIRVRARALEGKPRIKIIVLQFRG